MVQKDESYWLLGNVTTARKSPRLPSISLAASAIAWQRLAKSTHDKKTAGNESQLQHELPWSAVSSDSRATVEQTVVRMAITMTSPLPAMVESGDFPNHIRW